MRQLFLLVLLCTPISMVFTGEAGGSQPSVVAPAPKPYLGVKVDESATGFDPSQGLPVTEVIPGSSASAMGILVGDLLKTFNGQAIKSKDDLGRAIGSTKVGDQVKVELLRKSETGLNPKTVNGVMAVRPQVASLNKDLAVLREEVLAIRRQQEERKGKELSLADMLKMLKEIEDNMPAAVAEFKKQYPKGEFNIQIKIDIVSDKSAKDPITIGNQPGAQLNGDNVSAPVAPENETLPKINPQP
jgi:membrane-associated protease RseP (regulator of RpoE activity)